MTLTRPVQITENREIDMRKVGEKEEETQYYRHEITRGAFARTLPLPCRVNGDKAKARFKDGVLELTLPKVEKSKRQAIKVE